MSCVLCFFYCVIIIGSIVGSSFIEADYSMKIGIIVFVVGLIFSCAGFGSTGIGHGTCASSCQSGIGNVVSGSLFAIFQGLGMLRVFEVGMVCGVILFLGGIFDFQTIRIENLKFFDSVLNNTSNQFNNTFSAINETVRNEIDRLLNSTASNFANKVLDVIAHK